MHGAAVADLQFADDRDVVFRLAGDDAGAASGADVEVDGHSPLLRRFERRMAVKRGGSIVAFPSLASFCTNSLSLRYCSSVASRTKPRPSMLQWSCVIESAYFRPTFVTLHCFQSPCRPRRQNAASRGAEEKAVKPGFLTRRRDFVLLPAYGSAPPLTPPAVFRPYPSGIVTEFSA